MFDEWRQYLYYPLGVLPSIFFTARILLQWIQSEKRQRSYTSAAFWKLSFIGNFLFALHFLVQVQYFFTLLQSANCLISWRNLSIRQGFRPLSPIKIFAVLFGVFAGVTGLFLLQSLFFIGELDWIRTPLKLYDQKRVHHHALVHCFGLFGVIFFSSRFWIQWWLAEKNQLSELGKTFWWLSIVGSAMSLVYFVTIKDTINIVNYGFGLFPYMRNLILIKKSTLFPRAHPSKD